MLFIVNEYLLDYNYAINTICCSMQLEWTEEEVGYEIQENWD